MYAMKEMICQSDEQRQLVLDEIRAHQEIREPHIMPLMDHTFLRETDANEHVYMLFPYYRRGSLQDILNSKLPFGPFFSEAQALRLLTGICQGLHAMHNNTTEQRSHRDLCPRNVMITDSGDVALIDFGSVAPARITLPDRASALHLLVRVTAARVVHHV
jgi:serine/threonine kinase 16